MATRMSELLIGIGLFGLGLLTLGTGAFALDDGSAARTPNPRAEITGGIVVAKDNDDTALDGQGDPASLSGAASNTGPTGPTASLRPINPAVPTSAPEVGSATMEVQAYREEGDEEKRPSAGKEDRESKQDKGRGEKDDEDKGERKRQHAPEEDD